MTAMCEMCSGEGTTNLMLTAIPFFKGKARCEDIELMVASFTCNDCGYKSAEVTFAGKLEDFGVKMKCTIVSKTHVNRLIVKSEYASISIPELGVEIPARTQRGMMNSIEGILTKMAEGLKEGQEDRKVSDPESYEKLELFIAKTLQYARGDILPFTVLLDDPSGNSYIQNPYAPTSDPYNVIEYYLRTKAQIIVKFLHSSPQEMGYAVDDEVPPDTQPQAPAPAPVSSGPVPPSVPTSLPASVAAAAAALGSASGLETGAAVAAGHSVTEKSAQALDPTAAATATSREGGGPAGGSEGKEEAKKKPAKRYKYTTEEVKALTEKLQKLNQKADGTQSSPRVVVYQPQISAMGLDFSKPLQEESAGGQEVMEFENPCYACGAPGKNRMCVCTIPHFKELIVMCFECGSCGYKFAEVKGGGGLSEKGRKITLKAQKMSDLCRDVYKVREALSHSRIPARS